MVVNYRIYRLNGISKDKKSAKQNMINILANLPFPMKIHKKPIRPVQVVVKTQDTDVWSSMGINALSKGRVFIVSADVQEKNFNIDLPSIKGKTVFEFMREGVKVCGTSYVTKVIFLKKRMGLKSFIALIANDLMKEDTNVA